MRRETNLRRCCAALFNRLVQVGGGEDDQIPVPDGRNAKFGRGMNFNGDLGVFKFYRFSPLLLQGQKGVLHDIPIVAEGRFEGADDEHIQLNDNPRSLRKVISLHAIPR